MALPARFPIRFTGANKAMVLLGVVPEQCRVEVDEGELRVRMAWLFRLDVPARRRALGRGVATGGCSGWGAHGWRGTWLVNGSSSGLVRIELDPAGRGRVVGRWQSEVRVLVVSVEDPDALVDGLTGRAYEARRAGRVTGARRCRRFIRTAASSLWSSSSQPQAQIRTVVVGLVELGAGLEPSVDQLERGLDGAVHDVPSRPQLSAVDAHSGRIAPG